MDRQKKLPIAAFIATRNEEKNIGKCIDSLWPVQEIHVLDSKSSDATASLAAERGAIVHQFDYTGRYPKKRQWGLQTVATTQPWILLLDADEEVPEELWQEISEAIENQAASHAAYMITKGFWFLGKQFRFGGFSHSAVLLFQRGRGRFEDLDELVDSGLDMEVHERVLIDGTVGSLKTPLIHNDFKGLTNYLDKHNRYATWEAAVRIGYIRGASWGKDSISPKLFGNSQERRRFLKQIACRLPFESWAWFAYHYLIRLGFLEGRRGLIASQIRSQYISNVRAKMYEILLAERKTNHR
jgi:glycosyltransferase involved in cell wall biosynthesis